MITLNPTAGRGLRWRVEHQPFGAPAGVRAAKNSKLCTKIKQREFSGVEDLHRVARGFTLTEVLVVVFLIGLLSAIAINKIVGSLEKVRLARCKLELRGIQEEVWDAYVDNGTFPDPATFWETKWRGRKPGPYFYLVDGDGNKGHGNDLDGIDEDNPGASGDKRKGMDIDFVVLCQHDHKYLADYVYIVDNEPPMIAEGDNQPGYERFIKWEFGGPGNGGGGGQGDKKGKPKP